MSNLIRVNGNGLRTFGRQMRAAGVEARKTIDAGLLDLAAEVAAVAKMKSSWSTRIPSSIRAGGTRGAVYVRAGGAKAPHAAAYENHGRAGQFRHPVFGNRDVWVSQNARPFLSTAAAERVTPGSDAIAEAIARHIEES